ncbi:cytochrome c biogenesis heme-transporting ATPase CcmA [Parashewanella spongiae]|uniref:Cytochrome c biogenesis heme-transporting ATPase CcmA n=1 Tax=Parashewanella spongiae TaxID=342950 RepID=A0A3A6U157_9GAMM|nr:cytochrome c biogenesis heme-transporting ATPase CcmA [Parashewanella spongiae]MCL1079917.1 cytochrome c biogenesis heme-transporting ATPase CcmA [Parashewanella spongiae]RJY06424.1 cytochrome c biogenesis heme-transporting ATPase CcmA [Parashewanella spongiae]
MAQKTSVTPLLSADKLTCIREERILFDELCFNIYSGDIVQIEGPNGAGKTSLLRILTGLSRPYEGQVRFKNKPIGHCNEAFHQDLLYLGHKASVKPELTAEENLHVNLTLSGYTHFDAQSILSNVNLTGFEDALAGHLSAGQHRRTSLARLWHTQAKIWILDEPFTAIDKKGVEQLEHLFLKHIACGGCVIFTSHQDLSVISSQQLRRILLSGTDE